MAEFVDEFYRTWSGPYPFSSEAIQVHAPEETGVYQVLRVAESGLNRVYVGIVAAESGDRTIKGRLLEHFNGTGNSELARRRGEHDLAFAFCRCDGMTARQLESHMLVHGMPEFNKRRERTNYIPNITVH